MFKRALFSVLLLLSGILMGLGAAPDVIQRIGMDALNKCADPWYFCGVALMCVSMFMVGNSE